MKTHSLAIALLALTPACGAPSVDDVHQTAESLSSLVEEAYQAVERSTNDSRAIDRFYAALNVTQRDLGRAPLTRPVVPSWTSSQATADSYKKWLMEKVFTDDNIEARGAGSITFLVKGRSICADSSYPASDPSYVESCIKSWDDMQVRIVASGNPNATVMLDIVLGPKQRKVGTLIIEKDHALEARFYGSGYSAWLEDFAMSTTAQAYLSGLVFSGDFAYRIEKQGPLDFELTYSTLSNVQYGYTEDDGLKRSYSMAARAPNYRLHFDGSRGVQEAAIDLGPVTYSGVWSDFSYSADGGTKDTTPIEAAMQGITVELSTDASPAMAKGSFSLGNGPSRVTYGNTEVVNVSLAQPVSFTVDDGADGRLIIGFSAVAVDAAFHLGRVPRLAVDPAWADETYRLRVSNGTSLKLAAAQSQLGWKVMSGAFDLEALSSMSSVAAANGLCLVSPEMPSAQVPLLRVLATVACP
jgi:hypothetical protein